MKPGKLTGPSHKKGGVLLEAEGGEYIIKKSSVKKIGKAKLDKINKEGEIPMAKKGGFFAGMKERRQARKQKRKSKKIQKLADKGVKVIGDPKGANLKGRIRKGVKEITTTKGGAYATYGKESKAAGSFRSAFASARKAGKKTFSWDGRSYSTAVAKKPAAKPAAKPAEKKKDTSSFRTIKTGDITKTYLEKKKKRENIAAKKAAVIHEKAIKKGGGIVGDSIKTYSSGGYVEGE